MRRFRPFSSGAFRFAFVLAMGFALSSLALLFAVQHLVDRYVAEGLADAIETESAILSGEDRERGRAELIHAIERHTRAVQDHAFRYLLIDRVGRRQAGELPQTGAGTGWRNLTVMAPDQAGDHPLSILAKGVVLGDGAVLIVGGDMEDMRQLRRKLLGFTATAGVAIVILALIGGVGAGSVFLRRLDGMNRTISRIIRGHFSERLPRFGISPEFDELTDNLNVMLDRIEVLMDGLRQVSIDVAHDLRTPLTRLRHRLEEMQAGSDTAPMADQIDACIGQIDEIIRIFSSLLRIGSLENGKARENFSGLDLSELVARLGAAYAPAIEDGGRHLTVRTAPGILLRGDRELLAQAVTNLLENAVRHTPEGSRLCLQLSAEGTAVSVIVEDDGPGVPAQDRARVLQRFFRLESSRTTAGSGLGLALVAAIVRLHDGTITLEDAEPGLRVLLRLERMAPGLA